jgi:hypothetical protein
VIEMSVADDVSRNEFHGNSLLPRSVDQSVRRGVTLRTKSFE